MVEGSEARVASELAGELPNLLWLYQMGIVLFWIHDDSPGCARTFKLIDRTADIVVNLINLSSLTLMRPLVRRAVQLTSELRELSAPEPESAPG